MTPRLLESPAEMAAHGSLAGRYAAALAADGCARFIANAGSTLQLLVTGDRALPVTIDDGGYGRSYVASPHSAYVLYARREIELVGMRFGASAAQAALGLLDPVLRWAEVNRAVHIDNWLLSTNLHDGWDGAELPAVRQALADRYPDHFLILRSLDPWSSPALLEAARRDGWILVPARQIWVVDDLERDWRPRNNQANDRRALAASGLTIEEPARFDPPDAARVAELYSLLYLDRYSALNPVFTPEFITLSQDVGLLEYRIARAGDGRIMAVAGMMVRDGIMTPPVVGYDTGRPLSEGLYRIASWLFTDWAADRGLKLHGSAGAADFKRRRGARGEIEYMAVHADHLVAHRRRVLKALAGLLEKGLVPMMRRQGW